MASYKGKYLAKHRKTAKVNIPMCIASFLFCLTLISIHLTSGLYAKYISSASGNDSARVIIFGDITLTETGDFKDGNAYIIPGVDLTKKAVVDFAGSEAATYVFIEVAAAKWQPSDDNYSFAIYSEDKALMEWSVADTWTYLTTTDDTYVYYRALTPNTEIDTEDIIADDGNITVSEYITRSEILALTDLSIKLRATAVQSGGFENPTAAWNSLAAKEGSANE